MKKFTTYILALVIALQLTAVVNAATTATANTTKTETPENILIAAGPEYPLFTPKPDYLPGPTISTQKQSGAVTKWFTQEVLPGWTATLISFIGLVGFIMLIISGVRYLTAYGDEEAATSAKKMIIYSSLAMLLATSAYAIVSIIIKFSFE